MNSDHLYAMDEEWDTRCLDHRCEVRDRCQLYTDRDNPKARVRALTLKKNWESHKLFCEHYCQYFGVMNDEG